MVIMKRDQMKIGADTDSAWMRIHLSQVRNSLKPLLLDFYDCNQQLKASKQEESDFSVPARHRVPGERTTDMNVSSDSETGASHSRSNVRRHQSFDLSEEKEIQIR